MVTSRDPGSTGGTFPRILRKSVVSLTKLGMFDNNGFNIESINPDNGSVRVPIPEIIGLPGGVMFNVLAKSVTLDGSKSDTSSSSKKD